MKNKKSLIGTIILAIILLCIIIYVALDRHYTNQINKELAKIKSLGEPLTLQDITPKEISPQENAAYFYEAAIDCTAYKNFPAYSYSGSLTYSYSGSFLDKNSHEAFTSFMDVIKNHQNEINKSLKENELVFELLKLGYEKPKCRYDLRYQDGFNMKVLNFVACRSIAYGVTYKTLNYINENKPEKAVEILAHGLKFTRSLKTNGALLECMIRIAIEAILRQPLEYMAGKNIKTTYQPVLTEIDAILKERKTDFAESLMAERAGALDFYNNPSKYAELIHEYESPFLLSVIFPLYKTLLSPLYKADWLLLLRYYDKTIASVKVDITPPNPDKKIMKKYIICSLLIPNSSRGFEQHKKTLKALENLKQSLEKLNTK